MERILKVKDKFRTNELSLRPGGYIVIVEYKDGQIREYDKIKYPNLYILYTKNNPLVSNAYVKTE